MNIAELQEEVMAIVKSSEGLQELIEAISKSLHEVEESISAVLEGTNSDVLVNLKSQTEEAYNEFDQAHAALDDLNDAACTYANNL